ncbi:MAG: adenylate/guanylate cyclase domain-containing protein, partial [Deltaproteobacteria bacterium]|nr:adenylate/guanylate cyclase domain-containing protein [Deltaproteobacteria bacterium]
SARAVISFINTYFDATMPKVQDTHHGWLEDYVGDLACFFWPSKALLSEHKQKVRARRAALDLAFDQKFFFEELQDIDVEGCSSEKLEEVKHILGAGIGIAAGPVAMGNMGMTHGVQKFGILGDPLNLSSRVEALTRHFDTEILITEDLVEAARKCGNVRLVAQVRVKGRVESSQIYAIYDVKDGRGSSKVVERWENFLEQLRNHQDLSSDDGGFPSDARTLRMWRDKGLLQEDEGEWYFSLDEK